VRAALRPSIFAADISAVRFSVFSVPEQETSNDAAAIAVMRNLDFVIALKYSSAMTPWERGHGADIDGL